MHVKIQTWFPFTVQVYLNGHEWLAAKLTARGITFEKHDNAFVELADVEKANECARGFWRRDWPRLLNRLAGRVNPLFKDWLAGQNYYWVIDQAEFSTDVLFANKTALSSLRPWSVRARCSLFWRGADDDVFGTEVPRDIQGEVRTHWRRREPGAAVKHWVKSNAIKMYDKVGPGVADRDSDQRSQRVLRAPTPAQE